MAYGQVDSSITNDTVLTNSSGKRFVVVAYKANALLLLPVDNGSLQPNQTLAAGPGIGFTVNSFELPTVNKFSGDLFFIDNRLAFSPSNEQAVASRTVIQF